jgi:hypothetical protein
LAVLLCRELKQQSLFKSYRVNGKQAVDFGVFLQNFWDYDTSPYVKKRRYVKGAGGRHEKTSYDHRAMPVTWTVGNAPR